MDVGVAGAVIAGAVSEFDVRAMRQSSADAGGLAVVLANDHPASLAFASAQHLDLGGHHAQFGLRRLEEHAVQLLEDRRRWVLLAGHDARQVARRDPGPAARPCSG